MNSSLARRRQSASTEPSIGPAPSRRFSRIALSALLLLSPWVPAQAASAQQESPTIRSLLTGYGSVGYIADLEGETENDFTAFMSLVPIFQIEENLLVEGEIEFGLHGNETLVVLEHAEAHYLGFERVLLRAGKFHLPFGIWMHTNWVNKMPTPPLLYEDTHGEAAANALMPILFDVGAMAEWNIPLTDHWRTTAAIWLSQGPRPGAGGGHGHGDEANEAEHPDSGEVPEEAADAPALAYGSNFEDNNADKMVGIRLRGISMAGLTLQGSGFRAAYDEAGDLQVQGVNLSVAWAPGSGPDPMFEFRTEGTLLRQEYLHHEQKETVESTGYYVQVSREIGSFEPVLRWSHLPEAMAGHAPLIEERRQLALGLNYRMSPSVPIKLAYHWELNGRDGIAIELAMGF